MSDYRAPVKDMRFVMDELAGLPAISQLPGCKADKTAPSTSESGRIQMKSR